MLQRTTAARRLACGLAMVWLFLGCTQSSSEPGQAEVPIIEREDQGTLTPVDTPQAKEPKKERENDKDSRRAADVPERVWKVLKYIDEHHAPPKGHEGGREFHNAEKRLPVRDAHGERIRYQEWDVNPKVAGRSRDAERIVTGSDGSANYTSDHYRTFIKLR